MNFSRLDENERPIGVSVDDERIRLTFEGGLELSVPTSQYPRLQRASVDERSKWQIVGRGLGIHWPAVDEDLSIRGLFQTYRKLPEAPAEQIPALVSDLIKTTGRLNTLFPSRPFTPDGHLVGSIGEVVAEYIYGLELEACSTPQVDARTSDGRSVQVKLTGEKGSSYGLRWPLREGEAAADLLLCMKLSKRGFEEVYNGVFPLALLENRSSQRNGQITLSIASLRKLRAHSAISQERPFSSINRWFTPELEEVA